MSRSKPWLETWVVSEAEPEMVRGGTPIDDRAFMQDGERNAFICEVSAIFSDEKYRRAEFISAAPALVRALLDMETRAAVDGPATACCATPWRWDRKRETSRRLYAHAPDCLLDMALKASGLPDQASRDEARAEIGRMGK